MTTSWKRLSQGTESLLPKQRRLAFQIGGMLEGAEKVYTRSFSQTAAGRYVLVVLVNLGGGNWRVVTAREMTDSERRLYSKAMGGK
jgi:hypothetical protein